MDESYRRFDSKRQLGIRTRDLTIDELTSLQRCQYISRTLESGSQFIDALRFALPC